MTGFIDALEQTGQRFRSGDQRRARCLRLNAAKGKLHPVGCSPRRHPCVCVYLCKAEEQLFVFVFFFSMPDKAESDPDSDITCRNHFLKNSADLGRCLLISTPDNRAPVRRLTAGDFFFTVFYTFVS